MLDVQKSMQEKLAKVEAETQTQEERIQREAEDRAKEMLAVKEEEAAQMTAMLKAREEASEQAGKEQAEREKHLQEQLKQRDEMLAAEEQQRKALVTSSAEDSSKMQEEMAKLAAEREKFERDIEATKADQERLKAAEAEAVKAKELHATQEAELQAMRDEIASMAKGNAPKASMAGMGSSGFKPVPDMIAATAKKMARKAKGGRTDPVALQRVISTLPVLSACNDLRALTEIEATNRTLFQTLGGLNKMIDYLSPNGPNAPYATHIARTLPAIMDREGRNLFNQYATGTDSHGEVRLTYFSSLLVSKDPDDKEHACLAIASVAQDSQANRTALFTHGISVQVLEVLLETCRQQMPRQRLQRVVVMALSELAQDYDDFKNAIREAGGVQQLLQLLTPSHDPFVIKETLALIGRITQGNTGIQAELQSLGAIQVYSQLLFAQMHDTAITELAALALVNLVSEVCPRAWPNLSPSPSPSPAPTPTPNQVPKCMAEPSPSPLPLTPPLPHTRCPSAWPTWSSTRASAPSASSYSPPWHAPSPPRCCARSRSSSPCRAALSSASGARAPSATGARAPRAATARTRASSTTRRSCCVRRRAPTCASCCTIARRTRGRRRRSRRDPSSSASASPPPRPRPWSRVSRCSASTPYPTPNPYP